MQAEESTSTQPEPVASETNVPAQQVESQASENIPPVAVHVEPVETTSTVDPVEAAGAAATEVATVDPPREASTAEAIASSTVDPPRETEASTSVESAAAPSTAVASQVETSAPEQAPAPTLQAEPKAGNDVQSHSPTPPRLTLVNVPAQSKYTQVVEVKGMANQVYGSQVAWYFQADMDISFSVSIGSEKIKPPSRCVTNRGLYTTKPGAVCTVVFEWDNGFSWFYSKDIRYEIIVRSPEEVEKIMRDELKQPAKVKTTEDDEQHGRADAEAKNQQASSEGVEAKTEATAPPEASSELIAAVNQLRESYALKKQAWNVARTNVELKMKTALDALEAQYRQDQQQCEQQITQDQLALEREKDSLLATSKDFAELQQALMGLSPHKETS